MTLDLQALKAKLREYDKTLPKCPKKVERNVDFAPEWCQEGHPDWELYQGKSFYPCCRPEGHEGPCSETRPVLGWPGYDVLKELIDAYEARGTA